MQIPPINHPLITLDHVRIQIREKQEDVERTTCAPLESATGKNKRPQIIFPANGAGIALVRPAPKISKAVFQGGGIKGLCYPSFIRELGAEFVKNLREVAGSSAGAIMAFLLAAGVDMETIQNFLADLNIFKQLDGAVEGVEYGKGLFRAGNLTESLRDLTAREAKLYYEKIKQGPELQKIVNFKGFDQFIANAEKEFSKGLTFNDLKLLHQLNPDKFKQLHATAYVREKNETVYFNAEDFPDELCHIAVRASMGIPHVFKSIRLRSKDLSDGGEVTNVPLEVFEERSDYNPEETALFIFHREGKSYKILHEQPKLRGKSPFHKFNELVIKIINILKQLFSSLDLSNFEKAITIESRSLWYGPRPSLIRRVLGGPAHIEGLRRDGKKIHSLLSNTYVVPHAGLHTVNFNVDKATIERAIKEAATSAKEQAKWRQGNASYRFYPSGKETKNALSDEEQASLIESGFLKYAKQRLASHLEENRERKISEELELYSNLQDQHNEINLESAFEILRLIAKDTGKSWDW